MMEWKNIKNYEGLYKISNTGKVLSLKNNLILADRFNTKGYLHVALYKNGERKDKMIHRIVANHFIKKKPFKSIVNHIDSNKKNNIVHNLEWSTPSENTRHYHRNKIYE